jgi:hypothetical protein
MKKWQISKKAVCVFLAGLALIWIPGIAAAVSILDYGDMPGCSTSSNPASQPGVYAGNDAAYGMTPGDYWPRSGAACDDGIGSRSAGVTPYNFLWQGETHDRQFHANTAPVHESTPMILLGISLIGMAGFKKKFADK